jgi:N-acyl-D-amino-acid deacylase
MIVPDRDFYNFAKVAKALEDNGGAEAIRLTRYTPEPAMAGHTLAEIAANWNATPVEAYMRIVRATIAEATSDVEMEDIIGTSMSEDDVRWFIAQPEIMFCSDGALHDPHPRGAGAFPRVLGHYVREEKVLPLEQAIHKMTGRPASKIGLRDRGRIAKGYVADLVLFDPAVIIDRSTIEQPDAPPLGIPAVMVSGNGWSMAVGLRAGIRA